jgi:hypothetical protein
MCSSKPVGLQQRLDPQEPSSQIFLGDTINLPVIRQSTQLAWRVRSLLVFCILLAAYLVQGYSRFISPAPTRSMNHIGNIVIQLRPLGAAPCHSCATWQRLERDGHIIGPCGGMSTLPIRVAAKQSFLSHRPHDCLRYAR